MPIHATSAIQLKSWEEKPYDEAEGRPKLTRVTATNAFEGDIQAEGTLEYLMAYGAVACTFVGLERVVGRLAGRAGSFVLRHSGVYADGAVTCTWTVVPGSGTDQLTGLKGEGGFTPDPEHPVEHGKPWPFTLAYELA